MADRSDFRPLPGSTTKEYVNRETGEVVSYYKYLKAIDKKPKSKSRREREKRERVAAGLPAKPDRRSPFGSKKERKAISLDPADWTPREKQIIRNWITAHPYDATIDMVRGVDTRRLMDTPQLQTKYNLSQKLGVLDLKLNVGILTKREYNRQRAAVLKIRNVVDPIFERSYSDPTRQRLMDEAAAEYAKLRESSDPTKRLAMTKEEWQAERDKLDELDVFHEIFYH